MDLQTSVMNFDPSNQAMSQYVQTQNALQNFQIPLQQLQQGQGQIQLQGQQLPLLQLGQGGQFLINQQQLLQQLGQGQTIQLQGQGQNIQIPAQQGQSIQLPQHLQHLQLHNQQGQPIQIQGQNGQTLQIQGQNGQTIQLQGQNGQHIQLQTQSGQPIQLQGQNGQSIHIHGQHGQHIQVQGQNAQQIQLQGQNGQPIQIQTQNGQTIQLQGPNGQIMQLPNGQQIQIQGHQALQLQNHQLQGQTQQFQLQNQLGQVLQLQGQQLQAFQLPGQQLQMMSLQGQPCQVVQFQGPNGQIMQQVVPLMLGADQLGGLMNPLQQMFIQAQNQAPMVGQFVQTESGLVWQPTSMFGAMDSNAGAIQFPQATVISQNQAIDNTPSQEMPTNNVVDTSTEHDNNESQQSTLVHGDSLSSIPGSTNTTTTASATQPTGRIQIAAEDPEDETTQPLYVNAKQYHRILKRREARAKLESTGKVVRKRKKYLHESRHKHACQRSRGIGGRFFSIKVENEAEFGLKDDIDSPHHRNSEHSPHSIDNQTPSPPHQDRAGTTVLNGHL